MKSTMSPYIYPGLQSNTRMWLKNRTCFMTGELAIIAGSVCEVCDVSMDELKSKNRSAQITEARKIYAHLARRLYMFTYRRLGEYINRDHSTMVVAVNTCENFIEIDPNFRELYHLCLLKAKLSLDQNGHSNYRNTHKTVVTIAEVYELNKIQNGFKYQRLLT
tara:strand:+ start:874 stop:1362 length:489 start_codon:yes stop_codon:yes gene_type:complete